MKKNKYSLRYLPMFEHGLKRLHHKFDEVFLLINRLITNHHSHLGLGKYSKATLPNILSLLT
jgi:hypothetical protein